MIKKVNYIKDVRDAYINYISDDKNIDLKLCNKIFGYINNFDFLNKTEKDELDSFIKDYLFIDVHIADVILSNNSHVLKQQINRYMPLKVLDYESKINFAKGNFNKFFGSKKEKIKVRTKKKKCVK